MKKDRIVFRIMAVVLGLGAVLMANGCAEKRIGSTAGEESSAAAGAAGKSVETVKQDELASVEEPLSESDLVSEPGMSTGSQSGADGTQGRISSGGGGGASSTDGSALEDVLFDFDQYAIRKDAVSVLEGNSRWLRDQPGKSVMIEGHCDERGTQAYNLVLGEKRANAAKRYLENLGIPASRMQTTSYGEVRPFCKEHNDACWQQNRRAHFIVQ